jgi:hypothetical protein
MFFTTGCYSGKVWGGCADYTNSGGMDFCSEVELPNYFDSGVEKTVALVEREAKRYYGNVGGFRSDLELNNISVYILAKGPLLAKKCNKYYGDVWRCEEGLQGFNHAKGNHIELIWYSCSSLTILAHELFHSIEHFYLFGSTSDHSTPFIWGDRGALRNVNNELMIFCYGPDGVVK